MAKNHAARTRFTRTVVSIAVAMVAIVGAGVGFAASAFADTAATITSVLDGDGQLMISWSPAVSSSLLNYRIQYTDTTVYPSYPAVSPVISSSANSYTLTGLNDGDSYSLEVLAVLTSTILYSSPATGTPAGPPTAPSSVSATPADGSASLSWSAAGSNGGGNILHYVITAYSGGNAVLSPITTSSNAVSYTFPGLTNGTAYTFTVYGVNSAGNGAVSSASNSVTPAGVPGAPTGVNAVAGNGQATISWASANANGSNVIDYIVHCVECTGSGATLDTGSTALSATFTGLTNGSSYTFTVNAVNVTGTGTGSSPSTAVTPFGPPNAPAAPAVVAGNGSATVTWVAPTINGSAITGYTITYVDATNSAGNGTLTPTGLGTTAVVTGLTNGQSYSFTVAALSGAGTSQASQASVSITPVAPVVQSSTTPATPTAISAIAANGSASVHWAAPADGGSAITGYTVQFSDLTKPAHSVTDHVGPAARSDTANLVPGDRYTVKVTAANMYGDGSPSPGTPAVMPYTVPGSPTHLTAVPTGSGVTLHWLAPATTGYTAVTGYRLTIADRTAATTRTISVGSVLTATVRDLVSGHSYTFSAVALNAAGASATPAVSPIVTPIQVAVVTRATLPTAVGIGTNRTAVDFSLHLARPAAVTVTLLRGLTVVASTSLPAGGSVVTGSVTLDHTAVGHLGTYSWVVRDAITKQVVLRQATTIGQRSLLGLKATRTGTTITVQGSAKWISIRSGRPTAWSGETVAVQRWTRGGWRTIRTLHADALGHVSTTLSIRQHVELRLVDSRSGTTIGAVSNTATL